MANFTAVLGPGQSMHDGDTVTSMLGFYKAVNSSGNLLLKRVSDNSVVYSTGTGGHIGAVCTMVAATGDLEISVGGTVFFKSFTTHVNSSMEVTDDGHIYIYDPAGNKCWDNGSLLLALSLQLSAAKEKLTEAFDLVDRIEKAITSDQQSYASTSQAYEAAFEAEPTSAPRPMADGIRSAIRSRASAQ